MELTHQDVDGILKIIDEASHLDEIEFVVGGVRLHIVRNGSGCGEAPPAGVATVNPPNRAETTQ